MRLKHLLLFITAFICLNTHQASATPRKFRDTVRFRLSVAEKKNLMLSDSALNEIGLDSLLNMVQNVHLTLDQINNATSTGFDISDIIQNFSDLDSDVESISENMTIYNRILDVKNLQMFDVLLSDMQKRVEDWKQVLMDDNRELTAMRGQMNNFKKDTVLRSLLADSAFKSLYQVEINDLRTKWRTAKAAVNEHQSLVKQWLASTTNEYFETIDLHNRLKDLLYKTSLKSVGKEYNYLWDANTMTDSEMEANRQLVRRSYTGQRRILLDYFHHHETNQLWLLGCGILFGLWIFLNYRALESKKQEKGPGIHSFIFIDKHPLLPSMVFLVNLAPFFDLHPPTAYVEISEFLLVIVITALNYKTWPRRLFYYWLMVVSLFVAFSVTGILFTPNFSFRVVLIALNVIAAIFGIVWFKKLRHHTLLFASMIRVVSIIFVVLNLTALCCNLFGRLSLAKIFSVTSIYGLTQVVGLTVFIQIVLEGFHLQTLVNQFKGGLIAQLNFHRIQRLLNRILMLVAVCIWTIVFSVSLNIYNSTFTAAAEFLGKERKIGSTTFQIGSILVFVLVLYISNLLQQGVGSLLGRSENSWDPEVKKNGSRLAMTRLVLIVLGFMVAVAASGMPLDKITIVLGALGVGIGLGLQGIVNNLVSGVILIFEQPFRIGDYIQLGDKRGRVLDIGIRSSKLIMEEGAELIMPNADLLSGMVVNWTMRNDNMRIEMAISLVPDRTFEEVQAIITQELTLSEFVVKELPPEVLLVSQSVSAMNLNLQVWINDVHRQQFIKSTLLKEIYRALEKNGLKIN